MKMLANRISFTIGLIFAGVITSAQNSETTQTIQNDSNSFFLFAIIVVFVAMILLYFIFKLGYRYIIGRQKKNNESKTLEGKIIVHEEISGEVFAAISTALYLYESEQHDYESTILTINRATKTYSPWSSKIYGLRQVPRK